MFCALSRAKMLCVITLCSCLWGCGPVDPAANNNNTMPKPDMSSITEDMPADVYKPLKVATFNVRLLFDATCQSGRCGPAEFEQLPTPSELDARIIQLNDVLRVIDADVMVFQEIETEPLFKRMLGAFADRYPTQVFAETGGSASLDVAVISKGTLIETRYHKDTPLYTADNQRTSFARELPEVHLELDGQRVIIFGAHFVSKRSDDGPRREAEAKEAARLMALRDQEYPEALIFFAGDLNDTPDSAPLGEFFARGVASVAAGQPAEYYTHEYRGSYVVIDHILFMRRDKLFLDPSNVRAFHDDRAVGYAGSDHGAVRATFMIKQ